MSNYWIAVACREHVTNGVALGIAQFCHGKCAPAKRLKRGDRVIYYSSKVSMSSPIPCQQFTAIGEVIDDAPYQVDMGGGFMPYRRNMLYHPAQPVDIKPLIPLLPFIPNKKAWGVVFHYGFLSIDPLSFEIIAQHMLGTKSF